MPSLCEDPSETSTLQDGTKDELEARLLACLRDELGSSLQQKISAMELEVEARIFQNLREKLSSSQSPKESRGVEIGSLATSEELQNFQVGIVAVVGKYELKPSSWDLSMLIGLSVVKGRTNSFMASMLLTITVVMSAVFCALLLTNFVTPKFDDSVIKQLEQWRLNTAHMYSDVDKIRCHTLASRACSMDRGLASSADQVSTIVALENYLPPQDSSWMMAIRSGPALCMAALAVWYLSLAKEFANIERCCRAFLDLPTQRGRSVSVIGISSDCTVRLDSVSLHRKVWVVLVTLLRVLVLGVLAYSGTVFIVYTIEVEELILNCVALEVILSIGELTYCSLAPLKLQATMQKMALPLEDGHNRVVDFILSPFTQLVTGALSLTLVCLTLLMPYIDILKEARRTLCDGELDFAVSVMDEIGVPVMSYTSPHSGTSGHPLTFAQIAIRKAIHREGVNSLSNMFALVTTQDSWHEFKSFVANTDGYPGPDMDALVDYAVDDTFSAMDHRSYIARLQDLLGDSKATCHSLKESPKCLAYNNVESSAIRFLCPVSCGCGSLYSGIIMDTNIFCPDGGLNKVQELIKELACIDNASAMRRIEAVQAANFNSNVSCSTIARIDPWRCRKTSVAAFCPIACHCMSNDHVFCPPSCKAT